MSFPPAHPLESDSVSTHPNISASATPWNSASTASVAKSRPLPVPSMRVRYNLIKQPLATKRHRRRPAATPSSLSIRLPLSPRRPRGHPRLRTRNPVAHLLLRASLSRSQRPLRGGERPLRPSASLSPRGARLLRRRAELSFLNGLHPKSNFLAIKRASNELSKLSLSLSLQPRPPALKNPLTP